MLSLALFGCKTASTLRNISSDMSNNYTCSDGTIVAIPALCNSTLVPRDVSYVPWVYRAMTGQYYNAVPQTYLSFYDTGLLHAVYDFTYPINGATKVVNTSPNNVVLMGWGVASKTGGGGTFPNLKVQVPRNSATSIINSAINWVALNDSSIPLVEGANAIRYCESGQTCSTPTSYNSTEFASMISGYAPSSSDANYWFTSMGFSNAKTNWMTLDGSVDNFQIATRFNSMASVSNLFAYDWDTPFSGGTDSLRGALFMNPVSSRDITQVQQGFFLANPTAKVLVIPVGQPIQSVNGTKYTSLNNNVYLNNLYYVSTMTQPTSFAARLIPEGDYLDRWKNSIVDPNKSMPVVALPVMNLGGFTNNKLQYYLPDTSYNAGAVSNVTLSVPVSPYQVVYYYDSVSGNIRSGMAGFSSDWKNTGNRIMSSDRQAAATLTAAIANVQNAKYGGTSLTMHDALVTIAKQSTPMYGDVLDASNNPVTNIANAARTTTFVTDSNTTTTGLAGYRPRTLVINKANLPSFPSGTPANANEKNPLLLALTNASSDLNVGQQIARITSHDVVVMDNNTIIAMNDIYRTKDVIMGYNADGTTQMGVVDRIIYAASSTNHDKESNPTYYAFYFCKSGESDDSCRQPVRRIASRVFGFGMLNLRSLSTSTLDTVILRAPAAKSVAQSGIVSSPAFGDIFSTQSFTIQTSNSNLAGEKWTEYVDARNRVDSTANSIPFSSLFLSNAYYSNINNKYYNFGLGMGTFGMNLSSINSYSSTDSTNPLANSRFSDLTPMLSPARNAFGVIADSTSVANNISNVSYEGKIAGVSFAFRANYMPGLDIRDSANVGLNFLRFASLNYNPFTALVSNSYNAQGFLMEKSFYNGLKVGFGTVFGSSNFNSSTLYNNSLFQVNQNPSANVVSTASVEYHKSGNIVGLETGVLRESNTLLGTYSSGALSLGQNNTTAFAKTKVVQNIFGNLSLIGSFSIGQTQVGNNDGSLFAGVSSIVSRSLLTGIRLERFFGGNAEFTYTQPLANISGGATFIGTNGNMLISFVPTAIEQDFGVSYSKTKENVRVSFQAAYMLNRNNIANVRPTVGFFLTSSVKL